METTTKSVQSLLGMIESGELLLPEIQRRYVWKPSQAAALVDSLYRDYPSGSFLLWRSDAPVALRSAAFAAPTTNPLNRPLYLLDGQQRLTSLHRVYAGHPEAQVVFNVETERFQIQSAATKTDPRWCLVHKIMKEGRRSLVSELAVKLPGVNEDLIDERLNRLRNTFNYPYHIQVVELPYPEVTEIFVRVNSRGTTLRTVDLALATLSSRWPGTVQRLEAIEAKCADAGFPALEAGFHTRCLAALSTETGGLKGFQSASIEELESGWQQLQAGIAHLLPLLKNNAKIAGSGLLPSTNALIPVVAYLGAAEGGQLSNQDADALIYWLFGAFISGRYSGSVDTVIAQDIAAIRRPDPIRTLFQNFGDFGGRLVVTREAIAGKGASSPYFLFSYLAARRAGARDWWSGIEICTDSEGAFSLEYHHIYPRAQLAQDFTRAAINDLSNLAFISGKANRKIRARRPASYFAELEGDDLGCHFIPWHDNPPPPSRYFEFLTERRRLLVDGINELLDSYRPAAVMEGLSLITSPPSAVQVHFDLIGRDPRQFEQMLVRVEADGVTRHMIVGYPELTRFLDDVDGGLAAELSLSDEMTVVCKPGEDAIVIPVGGINITGSLDQWRTVLGREEADGAQPLPELSNLGETVQHSVSRVPFAVWDVD